MKRNETLNKKIFEMKRDLEIHTEVENKLAEKNRQITKTLKTMTDKLGTNESLMENSAFNNISNNISSVIKNNQTNQSILDESSLDKQNKSHIKINERLKEFQVITSLEKKIQKLEKALESKQEDFLSLKMNFSRLSDRLQHYEKKYLGVFNLFEEGLERLQNDEALKTMSQIYLNLDSLKSCDFTSFSSDQKYSILIILMKNLIPLINPGDLQHSDFNSKNFDKIKLKYHYQNEKNNKFFGPQKLTQKLNKSNYINSTNTSKQSGSYDMHTEPSKSIIKKDQVNLPRLNTHFL